MQILHPFAGSVQQYAEQLANPDSYRPGHCPQCQAKHPLTAHGFYTRTLIDMAFDGIIRVRRYLCQACQRTVSLLPEFILPYLRSSLTVIALFLIARLLHGCTLHAACQAAAQPGMPYQRGQFWVRRFQRQAAGLCAALAALTAPMAAPTHVTRALHMLQSIAFCSRNCAPTCWAGRAFWFPRGVAPHSGQLFHPPDRPHTAFASRPAPYSAYRPVMDAKAEKPDFGTPVYLRTPVSRRTGSRAVRTREW